MQNLEYSKPKRMPKGYYTKKAREYVKQFLKDIKNGTCTTGMAKIVNPSVQHEKTRFYNALKGLRRKKGIPVDVAIIEGDLWLIYEEKV